MSLKKTLFMMTLISVITAALLSAVSTINNAGFTNGVQVIMADSVYNSIVGSSRYSKVYPTLKKDADAETFENWLDDFCIENPGTHWLSYRMSDEQAAESFEQIRLLCWIRILLWSRLKWLNRENTGWQQCMDLEIYSAVL